MFKNTTPIANKYGCEIVTVEPKAKRIEGVLKTGTVIQISVFDTDALFRWPKVGEAWKVRQENGYWELEGIYQDEEDTYKITQANEGDVVINTETGIIRTTQGHNIPSKYVTKVYSGSTTKFYIEHNLKTQWVDVSVIKGNNEKMSEPSQFTVKIEGENAIKVTFASAPSTGAYVVVFG